MGMIGGGRCLALAGFQPTQGPHGESSTWVVLDLDHPTSLVAAKVAPGPGFVRMLRPGFFFYIEINEDGERVVDRLPLPGLTC